MQQKKSALAAETLFPGYSIRDNGLSDLTSTVPPKASMLQPSAMLFNVTTFLFGLPVIISAFFIHRSCKKRLFAMLLPLSCPTALVVGIYPNDNGWTMAFAGDLMGTYKKCKSFKCWLVHNRGLIL
jgi:hypothetical membrane protein